MSEQAENENKKENEIEIEKQQIAQQLQKKEQQTTENTDKIIPETAQTEQKGKKQTVYQQKMIEKFWKFTLISICFAFFYVLGTYRIESGLGVFIATLGEIGCCIAILKQWDIEMKKDTIYYIAMIAIMSLVMLWTNQTFLHFWQKKMILLLFLAMMLHQLYEDRQWSLKTYLYNLILLLMGSLISLFQPIEDFIKQMKNNQKKEKWSYIVLGLAIALPLTIFIISILAAADEVFKNMVIKLLGTLLLPQNIVIILFLFVLGYWIFYCFAAGLARNDMENKNKTGKQAEPVIAITFTSILLVVYVLFCLIQIVYLFIGKGNLPEGYTYASYARKGFFELLFVSVLNFLMIIISNLLFTKNKILDCILTAISVCNVILIASSAYRMILYVKAYHMTVMRVYVLWFLAMLAVSMIGVVYTIFQKQKKLYQYLFAVFFIFLTALSIMRPEAYVVKYNLAHMQQYAKAEIQHYMTFSSWDVTTELSKIDADKIMMFQDDDITGEDMMKNYFEKVIRQYHDRNFRQYHFGAAQAEKAAKKYLEEHQ